MVDEVAIPTDLSYLKNSDKFIGQGGMGKMVPLSPRKRKMPANKMLTFVINGLSTSFCIPAAYYLVKRTYSRGITSPCKPRIDRTRSFWL